MESNIGQCSSGKHLWEKIQDLYEGQKHVGQDKDVDNHAYPRIKESNNNDEEEAIEKELINVFKERKNMEKEKSTLKEEIVLIKLQVLEVETKEKESVR